MVPKLYKINGNYPNVDWAFTLTPQNMGMAAEQHSHPMDNLNGIQPALDAKSDVDHTHEMVSQLYVEDQISGDHEVVATATISNQSSPDVISIQGSTVKVGYTSPQTGNTQWVNNCNPKSERNMIEFTDDIEHISDIHTIETLTFRGNTNA